MPRPHIYYPIIDSHIHLYAESHISTLAWTSELPPTHPLNTQNSVSEYRTATTSQPPLKGFIFVETDRITSLFPHNWQYVLDEVSFLRRIKSNTPLPDHEGFNPGDADLLLGVVSWAPVAAPDHLSTFISQAGADTDFSNNGLIKGVRYLLQDKPQGHMRDTNFHEGLLELERLGCRTFDLGVDFRQGGAWQLSEAVEMLLKFYERSERKLNIVVNHFCKPDLRDMEEMNGETQTSSEEKTKVWEHAVRALADFPTTYMKFSGLFSELPVQETPMRIEELVERTRFECGVVFENFGAESIMFGSDWPVCMVGGGRDAWAHWVEFVAAVLEDQGLNEEEKRRVWAGTAKEVYDLDVDVD